MWEVATTPEERQQICQDLSWRGNPKQFNDADLPEEDDSKDEGDEEDD